MRLVKYLFANHRNYNWGITTTAVGLQLVPPGAPYPFGEHPKKYMFSTDKGRVLSDDIAILYIFKGRGWFVSEKSPRTSVGAGDVIFLFPGIWHNYAPDEDTGWDEAWICLSGDNAKKIVNEMGPDISQPIVKIGIKPDLYYAIERAYKIAYEEKTAYQQHLSGYAALILSSIYAYGKQGSYKDSPDTDRLSIAMKYMREHSAEQLSMEEVAIQAGMGYAKFRKMFRDYTGFSPQQYFLNLKLEESKDLLLNSNLSSKEIAYSLGSTSASHFSRIFSKHQKMTPIEFRNSMLHPL